MKEESITVKNLIKNYPENDFVTQKFDSLTLDALEKVCIIFSTPRSGSTYLCSKIHENCGIVGSCFYRNMDIISALGIWGVGIFEFAGRLTDRPTGRPADRPTGRPADRSRPRPRDFEAPRTTRRAEFRGG